MINIQIIDKNYPEFAHIKRLYFHAFPKSERDPISHLLAHDIEETDFVAFHDDDLFCGFAYLITFKDITHLLYFAIDENLRDFGYGRKAISALHEWKKGNRFIADVEAEDLKAQNEPQREKRIQFYLKNGYKLTDIKYSWNGVHYEILCHGGEISVEEFDEFWHHFEKYDKMGSFLYRLFKQK